MNEPLDFPFQEQFTEDERKSKIDGAKIGNFAAGAAAAAIIGALVFLALAIIIGGGVAFLKLVL